MTTDPRTPEGQKQRQTITVATGWLGVVIGLVLFAATVGHARSGLMPFAGIAVACGAYCVLARPFISSNAEAVIVSNVIREVSVPWDGISHAASRGSLVIHDTEGHKITVWAVGSRKARSPKMLRGEGTPPPGAESSPALLLPSDSPQALREVINAEAMDNPDGPSGRVVRWLPVPCLLMTVAVLALIVGFLR